MFQIKLREHPALESGCGVYGATEGVLDEMLYELIILRNGE
jgi:hypothetical protein